MNTTYDYDIFGSPITGDYTTGTDYGYLGKPYDSITGLYNYGYRDYSPQTVRFTTVDPIRDGSIKHDARIQQKLDELIKNNEKDIRKNQ